MYLPKPVEASLLLRTMAHTKKSLDLVDQSNSQKYL